tara:strand:+ start:1765 stop:2124 length:360 start_codon:yes stop_codon:yes gene_type:complete
LAFTVTYVVLRAWVSIVATDARIGKISETLLPILREAEGAGCRFRTGIGITLTPTLTVAHVILGCDVVVVACDPFIGNLRQTFLAVFGVVRNTGGRRRAFIVGAGADAKSAAYIVFSVH